MAVDQSQYPHAMLDDTTTGKPMPKIGAEITGSKAKEIINATNITVGPSAIFNLSTSIDVSTYKSLIGGMKLSAIPTANVDLLVVPQDSNGTEYGGNADTLVSVPNTAALNYGGTKKENRGIKARISIINNSTSTLTVNNVVVVGFPN